MPMLRAEASELLLKLGNKVCVKLRTLLGNKAIQTKHISADLIEGNLIGFFSAYFAAELIFSAAFTIVGALVKIVVDTGHFQYPFLFCQAAFSADSGCLVCCKVIVLYS